MITQLQLINIIIIIIIIKYLPALQPFMTSW
jgi:hypothetical protein